jgi:ABC-type transporter Mla subunit MlaD
MVGAVTTLIVIVAVFLAYNANNGLPFVPVYRVSVEVPNAARLGNNNEVRIGGNRVGVVESIEAMEAEASGTETADTSADPSASSTDTAGVHARLNLKLDQDSSPLPTDSVFRVRYRSSFGLKYLEIVRGEGEDAPEGYVFDGTDDGGSCKLPVDPETFTESLPEEAKNGCFQEQTEFDAIANTFDTKTRTAARVNLIGFGDAFAARGGSLNEAIGQLRPLVEGLKPVSEALSDPDTQLRRFIVSLGRTAELVEPVAFENADLFTQGMIAFGEISEDPEALRDAITTGRELFETALLDDGVLTPGEGALARQRAFLGDVAELSERLKPGVDQLGDALPVLNDAVRIGTPVLKQTPQTNEDLQEVFEELLNVVEQPTTKLSLQRLKETFDEAGPLAEFVTPAQTVCNYWNYWFTYLTEHITERDQVGFQQRIALVMTPFGGLNAHLPLLGNVEIPGEVQTPIAGYSGLQANGRAGLLPNPADEGLFDPHHLPILHGNPYAPAGQPFSADANGGATPDCQPGQTGYLLGDFRVPGQPASNPAFVMPDIPGSRGPTTMYLNQDGTRELRDTRIPEHQP